MGLDDLVPDDVDDSGSESSGSSGSSKSDDFVPPEEDPDMEVIGGGRYQKIFHKDKLEKVKDKLDELGHNPAEVLSGYTAEKRHETLHEAALAVERDEAPDGTAKERCDYCGKPCEGSCRNIEGLTIHINHTVGQVTTLLEDDE